MTTVRYFFVIILLIGHYASGMELKKSYSVTRITTIDDLKKFAQQFVVYKIAPQSSISPELAYGYIEPYYGHFGEVLYALIPLKMGHEYNQPIFFEEDKIFVKKMLTEKSLTMKSVPVEELDQLRDLIQNKGYLFCSWRPYEKLGFWGIFWQK